MSTPEETVAFLLETAGIRASEAELAILGRLYPAQRAAVDALYTLELAEAEEPQLVFSVYS
ncbi:hypothetical protein GCM10025768_00100 [Microbacterium pseudoresistens]|uniref:Uncharacterized protein n=1 Tax=Microbacterium pseudoresistens TaxID=640634 RepID=A0A7Y9EU21_9MICO|nr:hypothetical protein [Microbacterium pseudoresistens]NYD53846.1 hypothetical protein [Microbacterium pseudoresistens]